jgi:hypothetical protein
VIFARHYLEVALENLTGMLHIFLLRAPLKIGNPIIQLVPVLMIDARLLFWVGNECFGYYFMRRWIKIVAIFSREEVNKKISP